MDYTNFIKHLISFNIIKQAKDFSFKTIKPLFKKENIKEFELKLINNKTVYLYMNYYGSFISFNKSYIQEKKLSFFNLSMNGYDGSNSNPLIDLTNYLEMEDLTIPSINFSFNIIKDFIKTHKLDSRFYMTGFNDEMLTINIVLDDNRKHRVLFCNVNENSYNLKSYLHEFVTYGFKRGADWVKSDIKTISSKDNDELDFTKQFIKAIKNNSNLTPPSYILVSNNKNSINEKTLKLIDTIKFHREELERLKNTSLTDNYISFKNFKSKIVFLDNEINNIKKIISKEEDLLLKEILERNLNNLSDFYIKFVNDYQIYISNSINNMLSEVAV